MSRVWEKGTARVAEQMTDEAFVVVRLGAMQEAGHESNACEKPKTTENKQCYSCGGVGHLASDCPSIRVGAGFPGGGGGGGAKCYQCGQFGHIARSCPNPPAAGVDGAVAPAVAPVPRPIGGRVGGFAPRGGFGGARGGFFGAGRPGRCYGCGGFGHRAANCPTTARALGPKKCYSCQQEGHIARDCPNAAAPAEAATVA
ncbi:hypothetical protein JCM11641_003112 [Rhodosporidiobolus odoratus]